MNAGLVKSDTKRGWVVVLSFNKATSCKLTTSSH